MAMVTMACRFVTCQVKVTKMNKIDMTDYYIDMTHTITRREGLKKSSEFSAL